MIRTVTTSRRRLSPSTNMQRILARLAAGAAALSIIVITGVAPAAAHSSVAATLPADGAVVAALPADVSIEFNEVITVGDNAVRVVDTNGSDVALNAPVLNPVEGGVIMVSTFREPLQPGWYAVSWRAISADGHAVASTFTFTYGAATADSTKTAADVISDPAAPYRTASSVLRTLGYLVTLLAIGLLVATWPLAPVPAAAEAARKASAWAASIGLVVTPLILLNNAVLLNGGTFDNLKTTTLIALQSSTGTSLLVRVSALFGMCTAVLLAAERSTRIVAAVIGVAAGIGLAFSYAMAGHSTVVNWKYVAAPALVLHLFAGAVWLGGLPAVAWVFRKRSTFDDMTVARLVGRFSVAATISVSIVFVAGLALSVSMFTSPTEITGSYGTALLVKFAAVFFIAALGAYNHFVAVPALKKAAAQAATTSDEPSGETSNETSNETSDVSVVVRDDQPESAPNELSMPSGEDDAVAATSAVQASTKGARKQRAHLGKILKFEAFAVVLVAVLTGFVTNNAAPAAGGSHNAHLGVDGGGGHSEGGMLDVSLQAALADLEPRTVLSKLNDGEMQIDYRPARTNRENLFTFTLTGADGSVITPQGVKVSATHPATGLGPIVRTATSNGDGTFSWSTRDLGIAGDWVLDVTVQLDAVTSSTSQATVTIRPPADAANPSSSGMPADSTTTDSTTTNENPLTTNDTTTTPQEATR